MSELKKAVAVAVESKSFNLESWADRFFTATGEVTDIAQELKTVYPNFKKDRVDNESVKIAFESIRFQFCKQWIKKNLSKSKSVGKYLLLNEGKQEVKTKAEFNLIATVDTRLAGKSLNLSLDTPEGVYSYATKPAFLNNLKTKNVYAYDMVVTEIKRITLGIRAKVKSLDNEIAKDVIAESKATRKSRTKSESILDKLALWEGENFKSINQAIDRGDALGLAWLEIKPKYLEFKQLFKDIVKREKAQKYLAYPMLQTERSRAFFLVLIFWFPYIETSYHPRELCVTRALAMSYLTFGYLTSGYLRISFRGLLYEVMFHYEKSCSKSVPYIEYTLEHDLPFVNKGLPHVVPMFQ